MSKFLKGDSIKCIDDSPLPDGRTNLITKDKSYVCLDDSFIAYDGVTECVKVEADDGHSFGFRVDRFVHCNNSVTKNVNYFAINRDCSTGSF